MPISPEITEFVEAALSSLRRADIINASIMAKNADAHLRNASQYVTLTPSMAAAFSDTVQAIRKFSDAFNASCAFKFTQDVRNAQSEAISAIEQFAIEIESAAPNDLARALGLDWYTS